MLKKGWILFFLLGAGCTQNTEKSEEKGEELKRSISYQEREKTKFSETDPFDLSVPNSLTLEKQSKVEVTIKTSVPPPYLISVNNQFQYEATEKRSVIPIKLDIGEYVIMATILDDDGNTYLDGPVDLAKISAEEEDSATLPTGCIFFHYARKQADQLAIDYMVVNKAEDEFSVRIYLDGRYLTEHKVPQRLYVSGLTEGTHKLRLELADRQGAIVPGPFSKFEKTFQF